MKWFNLAAFVLQLIALLWFARIMWRLFRIHRELRAIYRELDRAEEMMMRSRTMEQLLARYERCRELLEHAEHIKNKL